MKFIVPKGATNRIFTVKIQANNVTTGAGLSGLDHTSGIVGGYVREGSTGVALAVDENVTTEGTYQAPSTVAHVRIGTPANMRAGTYELHFHNDLFLTGAEALTVTLGGATNMADLSLEFQFDSLTAGIVSSIDAIMADVADFADAVWNEDTTDHTTAGTFGEQLKTDVDAILVDTAEIGAAGAGLTGLGGMSTTMKAQVNTEVVDALTVDVVADSIPADGSRPTISQAAYMLVQFMTEQSKSGTTVTVRKPDGSTQLFQLTLDSATDPTSVTRSA